MKADSEDKYSISPSRERAVSMGTASDVTTPLGKGIWGKNGDRSWQIESKTSKTWRRESPLLPDHFSSWQLCLSILMSASPPGTSAVPVTLWPFCSTHKSICNAFLKVSSPSLPCHIWEMQMKAYSGTRPQHRASPAVSRGCSMDSNPAFLLTSGCYEAILCCELWSTVIPLPHNAEGFTICPKLSKHRQEL